MTSTAKSADFVKLVDLFDTLVTRKTRVLLSNNEDSKQQIHNVATRLGPCSDEDEEQKDILDNDEIDVPTTHDLLNTIEIPAELEPVLRNLVSLVDSRVPPMNVPSSSSSSLAASRPRSHTISTFQPQTTSIMESKLPKRYPFTFKMMLHKLYELEDWREKVKEALEMSKEKFKSLDSHDEAESMSVGSTSTSSSIPLSSSVTVVENDDENDKSPQPIKKRCIGRRVSLSTSGAHGLKGDIPTPTISALPDSSAETITTTTTKEWFYDSTSIQRSPPPPPPPTMVIHKRSSTMNLGLSTPRSPGLQRSRRARQASVGSLCIPKADSKGSGTLPPPPSPRHRRLVGQAPSSPPVAPPPSPRMTRHYHHHHHAVSIGGGKTFKVPVTRAKSTMGLNSGSNSASNQNGKRFFGSD